MIEFIKQGSFFFCFLIALSIPCYVFTLITLKKTKSPKNHILLLGFSMIIIFLGLTGLVYKIVEVNHISVCNTHANIFNLGPDINKALIYGGTGLLFGGPLVIFNLLGIVNKLCKPSTDNEQPKATKS